MAQPMTTMEAAFLAMEVPDVPRHVGVLMRFAPGPDGPLTGDVLRGVLAERIGDIPSARRVVVPSPLGLSRPGWRTLRSVDVDEHVTVTSLPGGGGDAELAGAVAAVHAEALDRTRPLWQLHVFTGRRDGRVAVYAKVHAAALDDSTGVDLMTGLLDHDSRGRPAIEPATPDVPDVPPAAGRRTRSADPRREQVRLAAGFPGRLAERAAQALGEQLPGLQATVAEVTRRTPGMEALARLLPTDDGDVEHRTARAPRLSLNAPIGPERVFTFGRLSSADVLAVKQRADVGFTDVVIATLTGALRRWLLAIDELPSSPLVVVVPVLVADQRGGPAHVSGIVTPLPTHLADPAARLARTYETLSAARRRHHAHPATLEQDLAKFAPPVVSSALGKLRRRLPATGFVSPAVNVGITNMPGPRHRVTLAGRPLESGHPVMSVSNLTPLHLGIQSGPEWVGLGAVGSPDGLEQLDHLMEAAVIELDELLTAVTPARRHRRPDSGPARTSSPRRRGSPPTPSRPSRPSRPRKSP